MPTYSGGLGVLAGDLVRSAVDLKIPLVAVTLLHRQGHSRQVLDAQGWQHEEPISWTVEDFLPAMPARTAVLVEGRTVHLQVWRYEVQGLGGFTVPVYFLDADLVAGCPLASNMLSHAGQRGACFSPATLLHRLPWSSLERSVLPVLRLAAAGALWHRDCSQRLRKVAMSSGDP